MERAIGKFKIGGYEQKAVIEVITEACFTSGFDVNEIMQVGCFGFRQVIVSNGNNLELYALFDVEPMK